MQTHWGHPTVKPCSSRSRRRINSLRGIGAYGATLAQGAAGRWQVADTGVPFVPELLDFPECDAGRFGPPQVRAQRLVISNDSN